MLRTATVNLKAAQDQNIDNHHQPQDGSPILQPTMSQEIYSRRAAAATGRSK
jgi:hypothetical protein